MLSLRNLRPRTVTGRRVYLVPLDTSDAAELFEVGRDERIWRYLPGDSFEGEEDALRFIRRALQEQLYGVQLPYAVRLRKNDMLVGTTCYMSIRPRHASVELGWTLFHPRWWTTRIPIETMFIMVNQAIETYGAGRVWLKTDARNDRMLRALEHAGICREGVLRRHLRVGEDQFRDSVVYSIIVDEWPELKRRTEPLWRGADNP